MPAKSNKKQRSWLRQLMFNCVKLLFTICVLISAYAVYLDSKIEQKLSGDHWQIPAKVYGQSLALMPTQAIARNQVINELERLNYRRVNRPTSAGEYAISSSKIDINRRAFSYIDSSYPQQRVMLKFNGNVLNSISDTNNRQALTRFSLEPKLLKRISNNSKEDRLFVPREHMPELLVSTLLHIEDRQFYQHKGIAPLSIARALVANIKAGRTVQGGSTLTQQLVKNVFLTRERSLLRKAKEAIYSLLIELKYTKDELLELYLNEVFLGQNGVLSVNGFGLASEFYFARPINELTTEQIALLVAIIKGPSYYNPKKYVQRALSRRNFILRQMVMQNFISDKQYARAVKTSLGLKNSVATHGQYHGFMSLVRHELNTYFSHNFAHSSGISIYTSLDSSAQNFAQQSLTQRIKKLEKSSKTNQLEGAVVVTNTQTGQIKAIVEGKNPHYAGFNRALYAKRPIGSLIKPFVVANALENAHKYTLATQLNDQAITLTNKKGVEWRPLNYDKKFRGKANILDSLVHSYNIPMVNLGMAVGLDTIANTLKRAGWNTPLALRPSMLLGAIENSPLKIAQLYQSLANNGQMRPLHTVLAVTVDNSVSYYPNHGPAIQVMSENASYLTRYALNQVTKHGTAKALRWKNSGLALAGKTGTTDDLRDSWYAGFDNHETAVVWLGRDDNKPTGLTGSSGALYVYSDYVKQRGGVSLDLTSPTGITLGHYDKSTGLASNQSCHNTLIIPTFSALVAGQDCGNSINGSEPSHRQKKSVFEAFFDLFSSD